MSQARILILAVIFIVTVSGGSSAQLGDGNLFTERAYVDSPALARDRDWLINYLTTGKTVEEGMNIRDQVERMSAAHVRSLLRFYHQKQHLDQQREVASEVNVSPNFGYGQANWYSPTESAPNPYARQQADEAEVRAWRANVVREANTRPHFNGSPYMPFSFTPLPLDYSIYSMDPDSPND